MELDFFFKIKIVDFETFSKYPQKLSFA